MADRAQPIKLVAFERGVTQQQFSLDTRTPYLVVHRVFNGLQVPTQQFIAKATRYFSLPATALFHTVDPIRVSQPLNTRAARRSRALAVQHRDKATGSR
jgi:hypothetical protein